MRSITRRELNHSLAQVLDQVLATGEPIEITTRGGRPLVIVPKAESTYEAWVRDGLTADAPADVSVLDSVTPVDSTASTEEILDAVRADRA